MIYDSSFADEVRKSWEECMDAVKNCIKEALNKEKEENTIQVTYNGFTGELVNLERIKCPPLNGAYIYDISIYDDEKRCTHSFTSVKLKDVKFLGGGVSFK